MPETLALLLPLLAVLATTAGAGVAASWLFERVRSWWAACPPSWHSPSDRYVELALSNRAGARVTVLVLSALISIIASALLARLTGGALGPAIDRAIAAALASQIYHLRTLLAQPSAAPSVEQLAGEYSISLVDAARVLEAQRQIRGK